MNIERTKLVMKYRNININNEFAKLKRVLLVPVAEKMFLSQQNSLTNILLKYNVEIIWADVIPGAKYQLFIRDPFMVIGDTLVVSYMKDKVRQLELSGANALLRDINQDKVIYTPHDIVIEGGDVIPHLEKLFVGQEGKRTNKAGFEFLKTKFNNVFSVIPIFMEFDQKKNPWLHLDCVFNPIWHDTAIVFPNGIKPESLLLIESTFSNIIRITEKEKNELAANVFSLGNKTIIVQERHTRIIKELKKKGFTVETMNFYETIEFDGYNRCMTCPIERNKI